MKNPIEQTLQHKARTIAASAVVLLLTLTFTVFGPEAFAAGKAGDELLVKVSAEQAEKVTFPSEDGDVTGGAPTMLDGYLFRPAGPGPFPAVVGMHGCGGLFTAGRINARYADWGERLAALGYVVLLPDSFTSRGIREVCTKKDRSGFSAHRERRRDADGALHWLQTQGMVQGDRVGLMGWSNGGSTVLATIGPPTKKEKNNDFRVAIAFYPGCTSFVKKENWRPRLPLTIFIGEVDDWTPAAPCKELVARATAQGCQADIVTFPNAYHGFDHPNLPLKTRKGLAYTVGGEGTAKIGTDPEGRAAVLESVPKLLERYLGRSGKE